MMRFLACFIAGLFVAQSSMAAMKISGAPGDGNDILWGEIKKLESELNSKTNKLNKCAAKNKNFQVAGIATIALAGAGVTKNISLYSKMKDQKKSAENMIRKIKLADTQSKEFENEMDKLLDNVDTEKYYKKLDSSLTVAEKLRFLEIAVDSSVIPEKESEVSESDKVLMEKVIHAIRDSQK